MFQTDVVIHRQSSHFGRRFHTTGHLLGHMPCLMGQVLFLSRSHMNVRTLCIGECLYRGRFVRIVIHPYIIHSKAR